MRENRKLPHPLLNNKRISLGKISSFRKPKKVRSGNKGKNMPGGPSRAPEAMGLRRSFLHSVPGIPNRLLGLSHQAFWRLLRSKKGL